MLTPSSRILRKLTGRTSRLGEMLKNSDAALGRWVQQGEPVSEMIAKEADLKVLGLVRDRALRDGNVKFVLEVGRQFCRLGAGDAEIHRHARQCIWANHIDEANQWFAKLSYVPATETPERFDTRIRLLIASGQNSTAAKILGSQSERETARYWFEIAKGYLSRGEFESARGIIERGKARFPLESSLALLSVQCTSAMKGFVAAEVELHSLSEMISPAAEGWQQVYATLLIDRGRYREALDYLGKALGRNRNLKGLYGLHQMAAMQCDQANAHSSVLERAAQRYPNDHEITVMRCNWAADQNDFDLAESLLPKIRDKSEWDYLAAKLGIACQQPGVERAHAAFESCVSGGVKYGGVESLMANYLYYYQAANGGVQRALELIAPLAATRRNDPGFIALYLRTLIACGKEEECQSLYELLPDGLASTAQISPFEMYFANLKGEHQAAKQGWRRYMTETAHMSLNAVSSYPKVIHLKYKENDGDVLAFLTVFNGIEYIDWFLNYYRQLGVDHFFIIDNGSDDGTFEKLAVQDDVSLFQNLGSFSESGCGVFWTNHLMRTYGVGHWCFHVDMDEAFVFPLHDKGRTLHDLLGYLDARGFEAVPSLMLDVYPEKLGHVPGENPFASSKYIDRDYFSMPCELPPYRFIQGGLRARLSGRSLMMTKSPLIKMSADTAYIANNHQHTHLRSSDVTGALLHYKFIGDMVGRIDEAIAREEHFMGARFYKSLRDPVATNDSEQSFLSEYSIEYEGPDQLVKLGLITGSRGWDAQKTDR